MTIETVLAHLRGWYPHWRSQLRTWTTEDFVVWLIVVLVCLITANSLAMRDK